jgi:protein-tyrosine phosphatase
MRPTAVCFVCLGNICRSPTAEAVFRTVVDEAGLNDVIHIESAGTSDWHVGGDADRRTVAAATARGIAMSHRAQQFTVRDFARFDHVIAMDDDNVAALRTIAPTPADAAKIRLLRSFDPDSPDGAVVPDPYYGGPKGFDEVIDMCEAACRGLLDELRE